eukprot:COSAG02_NODE_39_length_48074_cov_106.508890_40_plen_84_part_00
MGRRADDVEFVPFSIEVGGVWGPAEQKFFRECLALADDDRDVDLYHWSSNSRFQLSFPFHTDGVRITYSVHFTLSCIVRPCKG